MAEVPIYDANFFAMQLQVLWQKTEAFAGTYTNAPGIYKDSQFDKMIKDYLMLVSDKATASHLLNHESTRFFLVTKSINYFLTRDVLRVHVVRGFDTTADSEIGQMKGLMYTGKPFFF